ncbi:MAG: AbrB/MazE/SpoVT family DNA-binding domain-containing protein [Desulfobacteraceae bacterium]|nr:AbrB/MazE/SpoVT family DNA-binding domain-containing protein [Desulfobacteraceae bacterium]
MRITSEGQITIPVSIREKLGFLPDTEIRFEIEGETLRLYKAISDHNRGAVLISKMRGKATFDMSTGSIMDMTRGG